MVYFNNISMGSLGKIPLKIYVRFSVGVLESFTA